MKTGFTMKALSLAVLGLAGLGFGSSAFAVCPTGIAKADSPAGAWDQKSTLGGSLAISDGGYNSTACKLDAKLTSNVGGGSATVRDNTPTAEPHYRFRFFVNADTLTGQNSGQGVKIFSANTDTPYLGISEALKLTVFGNLAGNARSVGLVVSCDGSPSNQQSINTSLPAGTNSIQVEWVKGTSAAVKIWVNSTTEGTPSNTITCNTNGWSVDYVAMGLANAAPGFRNGISGAPAQINKIVSFDEFDSRRSSFIN